MRKLIFGIIAIITISCTGHSQVTQKEIGSNKNGVYSVTIDKEYLKEVLELQLRKDKNEAKLTTFEIKKDTIENTTKEYYILVAQNDSGDTKIAFDLELNSNNIFVATFSSRFMIASGTCTCSGSCTKGCDPKHWMDSEGDLNWRCSACTQTGKTCNKSVTDQ